MSISKKLQTVNPAVDLAWDLDYAYYSGGSEGDDSVAGATYTGKSFTDLARFSGFGVFIGDNGTKLYGLDGGVVYQFTLSTPYDISTAVYASKSVTVSGQDTNVQAFSFSPDGTKLYTAGGTTDDCYQYDLSTAWDLSTGSYASKFLNTSVENSQPRNIRFNSDGTVAVVLNNGTLYEYSLSTGYDLSTGSYNSVSFGFTGVSGIVRDFDFNSDGSLLYALDIINDLIELFTLSTPYDISTAVLSDVTVSVPADTASLHQIDNFIVISLNPNDSAQLYSLNNRGIEGLDGAAYTLKNNNMTETDVQGLTFKPDGTKYYIIGSNNDDVYQYDLSTAWDLDTATFSSSYAAPQVTTFGYDVMFNSTGTIMYLLELNNDTIYQYTLSTAWDVSTASYASKSFTTTAQATIPISINLNATDDKLYVLDNNTSIYEYNLSTAGDISTAAYSSNSLSIASSVQGFCFNSSGSKLYAVLDGSTDAVRMYRLTTPFDISTAIYTGVTVSVGTAPKDVYVGNSGFMYIVDQAADLIYQYVLGGVDIQNISTLSSVGDGSYFKPDGTMYYLSYGFGDGATSLKYVTQYVLSTPWDLSTASYVNRKSIVSDGRDITFKPDGTKMYVALASVGSVYQYNLSTAWDITTAVQGPDESFGSGNALYGVRLNSAGTKIYVLNGSTDTLIERPLSTAYDLSTAGATSATLDLSATPTIGYPRFSDDGTQLFMFTSSAIYEYSLSTAWDISTASSVGNVSYSDIGLYVSSGFGIGGAEFTNGGTTITLAYPATHFTITLGIQE